MPEEDVDAGVRAFDLSGFTDPFVPRGFGAGVDEDVAAGRGAGVDERGTDGFTTGFGAAFGAGVAFTFSFAIGSATGLVTRPRESTVIGVRGCLGAGSDDVPAFARCGVPIPTPMFVRSRCVRCAGVSAG